jgi:hypothetical protein
VNHQLLLALDTLPSQPKEMSRPKKLEQLEKNLFDSVGKSMQEHDGWDISLRFKQDILEKSFLEAKQMIHLIQENRKITAISMEQIEIFTSYA